MDRGSAWVRENPRAITGDRSFYDACHDGREPGGNSSVKGREEVARPNTERLLIIPGILELKPVSPLHAIMAGLTIQ